MRRFIIFSIIFFLIILVAGTGAFIFSMQQIIRINKSNELSQMIEIERIKLETSVNNEITIVLKMANSPLIKSYFANPGNSELEKIVFEEITAYRYAFAAQTVFWVNDIDKIFYFDDDLPYTLDLTRSENYWYLMTLNETKVYNFNINYNPDLNVTKLWINAPVFSASRKPLGMVGTGIDISTFLDMVYKNYTGSAHFYFFNAAGEITSARDASLVAAKKNIDEELHDAGIDIVAGAKTLKPGETQTFDTPLGKIALGTVPLLEWYSVALMPDSIDDYKSAMTVLFLVMFVVIVLIFIIFNIFIAGLLEPLRKTMKEAEAANQAKSHFLSTMSHEMRTPMSAIIGMTTIGKNAGDIEHKNYAFNKIEDASTHLLGIINDVLDMSKIEANRLELSPIEFNFEKMLQKIITVIKFRIDEKRQRLSLKVDGKIPPFIVGDDQRLSQVILNLLSNAVKFTPEQGEIGLDVSFSCEKEGVCELLFKITDNGIGISPGQQEKLFDMFVQAESDISREYGGTGLGLAISKRIVELMDGRIWVESELGKGARFFFTAPVTRGDKNFHSMLDSKIKWENIRVLAVDDELETRNYFKDLFDVLDAECDVAADGFQARQLIEDRGGYDMYFIDWRMFGTDKIELTEKNRPHGKRPSVVVMISSTDWLEIKDRTLDEGVDKYLLKPLFSSTIINCINECLTLDEARQDEIPGADTGVKFNGRKVLLAEDVEINREILISLLHDTGLIIDVAENGKDALDMIEAEPDKYDIVFMDMQMPKMNGLEATQRIRELPENAARKIPIIAMTANVFKEDIEKCLAAGMNDHIGKPLDVKEVLEKLRKYID